MELTGWEAAQKRAAQERKEEQKASSATESGATAARQEAPPKRNCPVQDVCPYCGGALQEGVIRSRDHLKWYGTKEGTADLDFRGAFLPKAQAWLCPSCGIVILRTRD